MVSVAADGETVDSTVEYASESVTEYHWLIAVTTDGSEHKQPRRTTPSLHEPQHGVDRDLEPRAVKQRPVVAADPRHRSHPQRIQLRVNVLEAGLLQAVAHHRDPRMPIRWRFVVAERLAVPRDVMRPRPQAGARV